MAAVVGDEIVKDGETYILSSAEVPCPPSARALLETVRSVLSLGTVQRMVLTPKSLGVEWFRRITESPALSLDAPPQEDLVALETVMSNVETEEVEGDTDVSSLLLAMKSVAEAGYYPAYIVCGDQAKLSAAFSDWVAEPYSDGTKFIAGVPVVSASALLSEHAVLVLGSVLPMVDLAGSKVGCQFVLSSEDISDGE
jgi:hypothetical protein